MTDDQVTKKRKVDVIDVLDSDVEEVQASTSSGSTGSETPNEGSETREDEVKRLRAALKKADDTIATMEKSRRTIAARLQALGEVVLLEPRTAEWLREKIAELEDDFYSNVSEIGCDEDATEEQRFDSTYIQRLKDALEGGFPCDKNGYINAEGRYIAFAPTDEELEDFRWSDVGFTN
ncbi:hypothetical protein A1Q1_05923 [Trichosporon asahii var. asahii CBS 2479]|uniref:Uncharacterized protein n=1 Tax=Trichosporon asahii var. asahii (strain ATCC 90039 / CBS 2479 / JCM 2466 / KCTC 7840 / NBRC 103889/ NCYC 2677 / UAMH 7654) TaxID=1186058 RepID=J6EN59_TRIAS|nr:hypothetical protein A1Q1_05923 [Trichosporon asahii var. asahii CBS 2479]EJT45774.1 hypothetical protein A1Q1_05923 [Trichosporon asahii var. asahii CBS 2479]